MILLMVFFLFQLFLIQFESIWDLSQDDVMLFCSCSFTINTSINIPWSSSNPVRPSAIVSALNTANGIYVLSLQFAIITMFCTNNYLNPLNDSADDNDIYDSSIVMLFWPHSLIFIYIGCWLCLFWRLYWYYIKFDWGGLWYYIYYHPILVSNQLRLLLPLPISLLYAK